MELGLAQLQLRTPEPIQKNRSVYCSLDGVPTAPQASPGL